MLSRLPNRRTPQRSGSSFQPVLHSTVRAYQWQPAQEAIGAAPSQAVVSQRSRAERQVSDHPRRPQGRTANPPSGPDSPPSSRRQRKQRRRTLDPAGHRVQLPHHTWASAPCQQLPRAGKRRAGELADLVLGGGARTVLLRTGHGKFHARLLQAEAAQRESEQPCYYACYKVKILSASLTGEMVI